MNPKVKCFECGDKGWNYPGQWSIGLIPYNAIIQIPCAYCTEGEKFRAVREWINCGGTVIVLPIGKWHGLAKRQNNEPNPAAQPSEQDRETGLRVANLHRADYDHMLDDVSVSLLAESVAQVIASARAEEREKAEVRDKMLRERITEAQEMLKHSVVCSTMQRLQKVVESAFTILRIRRPKGARMIDHSKARIEYENHCSRHTCPKGHVHIYGFMSKTNRRNKTTAMYCPTCTKAYPDPIVEDKVTQEPA